MCCANYWKRIVSFALAAMLGVFITGFFRDFTDNDKAAAVVIPIRVIKEMPTSNGEGSGGGSGSDRRVDIYRAGINPLQIISKPSPAYTSAARQSAITGVVRLRVTFLDSGQIGSVLPVSVLPYGLTEQAIEAAKQIKFEPATIDGKPITVTKLVEYNFSIY